MKKLYFTIIFLIGTIHLLKAGFYELDVSDKVINFSSYCKQGKITVFIMSQHGCKPCIYAKEFFMEQYANNKYVDVYYCMRTKNNEDLKYFQNRASTQMWGYIEAYTASPRIYIFSPTGNPQCILGSFKSEVVKDVMDGLLESMSYYKKELLSFANSDNSSSKSTNSKVIVEDCEDYITENTNLKKTLDNCSNDKKTLESEIKRLKSNISDYQKNNEILEHKNVQLKKTNENLHNEILLFSNEIKKGVSEITILNEKILQLTDSINNAIKETEKAEQSLSDTWYNLAKEYERQIESKQVKKEIKPFLINQAKLFYENAMHLGKECEKEYVNFKKKNQLID